MKFNKMKKHTLLLTFAFIFLSSFLNAQTKKDYQDKVRAYKAAYITEKLSLSESEAQKFWPIYNDYSEQMVKLHREERFKIKKRISEVGGIDKLTEHEAKQILQKITLIDQNRTELKTSFFTKISKFLSYKKILTLEVTEHEFNRKLIKKLRGPKNFDH